MDPRKNPYTPEAGTKPPVLVGRDGQLESFDILLERLENGYAEQSMIITGLRGVGKTVLLDVFREKAERRDWATVECEIERKSTFAPKVAAQTRKALLQIAPKARWKERARRAAATLKSFTLTFNPEGTMTAGSTSTRWPEPPTVARSPRTSPICSSRSARRLEHGVGVILLVDEIQFLQQHELEGLIVALHKCARRALPITLVERAPADATARGRGQVLQRAPVPLRR